MVEHSLSDVTEPVDEAAGGSTSTRLRTLTVLDLAFVLVAVATLVTYFRWNRNVVLNSDDWLIAPRGNSFVDYFRPYEDNFSLVTIAIYHAFFSVVGFGTYWPLRLIGIASSLAIAVGVFVVIRSRLGPALALLAGVAVLWYPGTLLIPSLFNHWLALAGCVVCAYALPRPGRVFDVVVAVALTFALSTSAVGVAGAAACVVFVAASRCPLRRCLAVAVPAVLFVLWWLTLGLSGHTSSTGPTRSFSDTARFVFDGILYSFQVTATDSRWLGSVLALAFTLLLALRLRRGVRAAAQQLAWTSAMVTWWTGLAYQRAFFGPSTFRYRLVGFTFAVLAVVPLRVPERARRLATSSAATIAAVALAAFVVVLNSSGIHSLAQREVPNYRRIQQQLIVLERGPETVPDSRVVRFDVFTTMTARQYRDLVARYGSPEGSRPEHPDAEIVSLSRIAPTKIDATTGSCVPVGAELRVSATNDDQNGFNPLTKLVLRAGSSAATVELRRFEESWTSIGRIDADTTAEIDLPVLMAPTPWFVRAAGACRVTG